MTNTVKFNMIELGQSMLSLSKNAAMVSGKKSSSEIRPEHLLEVLFSDGHRFFQDDLNKLNKEGRYSLETDPAVILARLKSIPNQEQGKRQASPPLSDTSEKLLHDAEMISILRNCPVTRQLLLEAFVVETYLSEENTDLDISGYALGMRKPPQETTQILEAPEGMKKVARSSLVALEADAINSQRLEGKIHAMQTLKSSRNQMRAVAEQAPTWEEALLSLNYQYTKPIQDYIKVKVYVNMMANNLDDSAQSGLDAASDFFLTKLSDGELYRKYVAFSKARPDARFRAYIIESANNFVIDFLKRKSKERKMFIPIERQENSSDLIPSRQPGPATQARKSERKSIVSGVLQDFISELLEPSTKPSKETNKLYFYIIHERLVSPIFYGYEEPTFRKMAEKLSLLTGRIWTVTQISNREITVMSKLKGKMSLALA